MKKILPLLLGAGLLVSCTNSRPIDPTQSGSSSPQEAPYMTALKNVSNQISQTDDFMQCMVSSVQSCNQAVTNNLAITANDPSICDGLAGWTGESSGAIEGCKYAVLLPQALAQKNATPCDTLSEEYRNACGRELYKRLAQETGDITQCDHIPDHGDNVGGDSEKDLCIFNVISTRVTPETSSKECDVIESEALKINCKYVVDSQKELQRTLPELTPPTVETLPAVPEVTASGAITNSGDSLSGEALPMDTATSSTIQ